MGADPIAICQLHGVSGVVHWHEHVKRRSINQWFTPLYGIDNLPMAIMDARKQMQ